MVENICYSPLELEKLCANVIVKEFWDDNEYIFNNTINNLGLPYIIKNNIYGRYLIIKHILDNSKRSNNK